MYRWYDENNGWIKVIANEENEVITAYPGE